MKLTRLVISFVVHKTSSEKDTTRKLVSDATNYYRIVGGGDDHYHIAENILKIHSSEFLEICVSV